MASMRAAHFVLLASVFNLTGATLSGSSTDGTDEYMYVFESMALAIMLLLASTCWLLTGKGKEAIPHGPRTVSNAAVQCTLLDPQIGTELRGPSGTIYFAQHSVRWHQDSRCKHLASASTKMNQLTPCKTCSFHAHWAVLVKRAVLATIVVEWYSVRCVLAQGERQTRVRRGCAGDRWGGMGRSVHDCEVDGFFLFYLHLLASIWDILRRFASI